MYRLAQRHGQTDRQTGRHNLYTSSFRQAAAKQESIARSSLRLLWTTYRKDDRAMRHIMSALKKFESPD